MKFKELKIDIVSPSLIDILQFILEV